MGGRRKGHRGSQGVEEWNKMGMREVHYRRGRKEGEKMIR
jgi:hypothetical protein